MAYSEGFCCRLNGRAESEVAGACAALFGAVIRAAERWKSIKATEFERRQLSPRRTNSIRNTRSKSISQRAQPKRKYPAVLRLDPPAASRSTHGTPGLSIPTRGHSANPGLTKC